MKTVVLTAALALAGSSAQAAGLRFACSTPAEQDALHASLSRYLTRFQIEPSWVVAEPAPSGIDYHLNDELATVSPVNFIRHAPFKLTEDVVALPTRPGKESEANVRHVVTASKKEIILALLHPGRTTDMPCDVDALREHVDLRQNVVAWTERLTWTFPDGTAASWNKRYWKEGTPRNKQDTVAAVADAFLRQEAYSIGCYTASKLVYVQAALDYYARLNPQEQKLSSVLNCLWSDKDPLVGVEPEAMWFFEADFNPKKKDRPGKLTYLLQDVAPENFVPGDWVYMLNPDPVSYAKAGYEGSNAIYLGRGKFDDYYNDHNHSYTYTEKLDEVYQWRNGVYSRARDSGKIVPLTHEEILALGKSPENGGLVLSYRAVPYVFSKEDPGCRLN